MDLPGRLITIISVGALAAVGTLVWNAHRHGTEARALARSACEDRGQQQSATVRQVTPAESADALAIAAADPLVQGLWHGIRPPVAKRLGGRGLFVFPNQPVSDNGPLGVSTSVTLNLPRALPTGVYRWRSAKWTYVNDCEADGVTSVTIQDADGDAGAIGEGQPYAGTPVVLIEVSLTRHRVVTVTPNGGQSEAWHPVGEPEVIVP